MDTVGELERANSIWGFLHIPSKRCISVIKQDEQWHSGRSILALVWKAIAASKPGTNKHESQKVYFLRQSNAVSHLMSHSSILTSS